MATLRHLVDWGKLARQASGRAIDFLLPPRCAACNRQTSASGAVCPDCWGKVDFIEYPYCARLGIPFPHEIGEGALSAEAIARPPLFERARAVAAYDGPARELVTALKFRDRTDLAPLMARWMARAATDLLEDADRIAPIPLHRRRIWQRKHNQAALLTNALARECGIATTPDLLARKRRTRAQIGLNARQRTENVRGAFAVEPRHRNLVRDAHILLVDDVYTTGATVTAAARALLRAGAGSVDVLTFARVVGPAQMTI